ncbi:MAG TPA: TonB-dependent receptor [Bacteroidetes bacterium]|nr:TonB-dependent receptor [Bacteroidota bacterium]
MARYLLLTFAFLLSALALSAQTTLQGKVTDGDTGEEIIFGTVALFKNDVLVTGTETDIEGFYSITALDAGTYDVVFSYTGYQDKKISGVVITSGKTNRLDAKIRSGIDLKEVIVTYKRPLISQDETTQGQVFSSDDIKKLPTRNVNAMASLGAGASSGDDGEAISIRGSRTNATNYYIDGVRVSGNSVPAQFIEELQVITGGIEAKYGDVTGGIISITTKGPSDKFGGGLEMETSEFLDAYDNRLASLNLSGPLLKQKGNTILGYRIGGQYQYAGEDDPPATGVFAAKDEYIKKLEENPVRRVGETSFPEANFASSEDVNVLDARPNESRTTIDLTGKLDANLGKNIDVTLSGTYYNIDNQFTPSSSDGSNSWALFNNHNNPHSIDTRYRTNFRFRHRLGTTSAAATDDDTARKGSVIQNAVYTLQFGYEKDNFSIKDPRHGDNLFDYGYIGKFDLTWVPTIDSQQNRLLENFAWLGDTIPLVVETYSEHVDFSRQYNGYSFDGSPNPILAKYNINPDDITNFDDFDVRNGRVVSGLRSTWSDHFANVGTVYNLNRKRQTELYTFNANTSFQLVPGGSGNSRHNIQFGILYEQRVERGYDISPRGLWTLAELLANQHLEGAAIDSSQVIGTYTGTYQLAAFDPANPGQLFPLIDADGVVQSFNNFEYSIFALDPIINSGSKFFREVRALDGTPVNQYFNVNGLDPSQLSLDMFSARELNDQRTLTNIDYWGYDYLGNSIDNVNFDDFFTAKDADGLRTFPVAAFRPNYQAAFIQDKFTYKDIIFRVGLRIDRFDANTKVLKDPFSLYEVMGAGDFSSRFGTQLPGNIGEDFKVYVTGEGSESVKAYRNGETWFAANGAQANDGSEIFGGGLVFPRYLEEDETKRDITNENFDPSISFEDYKVQVNWMPRLAFSFPISDDANFFAHYDVLVQRPPSNSRISPLSYFYWESEGSDLRNNANLKPERTVDYEVGFQQKLSNSSALKLSAYYRELRDMIQRRWILFAAPVTEYQTFDNLDFATVKGFNISYELRRTGNVSLTLAYALQFADGTGSDANSSRGLSSRGIQRALFPMSFDERHRLTSVLDYRYLSGDKYNGPRINGIDVFSNTGLNIITRAVSGRPYTAARQPQAFGGAGTKGAINGSRLPWNITVDARIDKSFNLTKPGAKKALGLNVYFRVSNVFDRRNIRNVYRASGSPDDDGFLTSAQGQSFLNTSQFLDAAGNLDVALKNSFLSSYSWRLLNPDNYTLPRRMYLGAILDF